MGEREESEEEEREEEDEKEGGNEKLWENWVSKASCIFCNRSQIKEGSNFGIFHEMKSCSLFAASLSLPLRIKPSKKKRSERDN
jgi:hypothetical protein